MARRLSQRRPVHVPQGEVGRQQLEQRDTQSDTAHWGQRGHTGISGVIPGQGTGRGVEDIKGDSAVVDSVIGHC